MRMLSWLADRFAWQAAEKTLDWDVEQEMSGDVEKALVAFIQIEEQDVERHRVALAQIARTWYAQQGAARLAHLLTKPGDLIIASDFYFQTEHLEETRSGFTHSVLLEMMPSVGKRKAQPWQFDRVLGFHYAYPVAELTHSVPVELVRLAPRIAARRRRYIWVAVRIPKAVRFGRGLSSGQVSLSNLFAHIKRQVAHCSRLYTVPGFYYSATTWIVNHPANRRLLRNVWRQRTHTGYDYRDLDPASLQRLKGKVLYVPVGLLR